MQVPLTRCGFTEYSELETRMEEQSRAEQSRAEQSRAEQSRARQGWAGHEDEEIRLLELERDLGGEFPSFSYSFHGDRSTGLHV